MGDILEHMGVAVRSEEPAAAPDDLEIFEEAEDDIEEDLEEAPILDAIFENAILSAGKTDELDAFWDSAADDVAEDVSSGDVLSYDQALQLGLTPEEDAE